jgi:ABC-type multidrug transport system fused ATPase/permease subunit
LKKGKVVENGLHDDLLEAEGEYFELYQKQLREAQPS